MNPCMHILVNFAIPVQIVVCVSVFFFLSFLSSHRKKSVVFTVTFLRIAEKRISFHKFVL